jgi:hypothetical protein
MLTITKTGWYVHFFSLKFLEVWDTNIIISKGVKNMKMNRKALGKLMSEFSQELGIADQKKTGSMGRKMLAAAGSVAGFFLIRSIYNRIK